MTIFLKKFGTTLSGRHLGREALAAFKPTLGDIKADEKVIIDFEGVMTFTPSWGDEFLSPLLDRFGKNLSLKNTENLSVEATIKILEKIHKVKFTIE